MSMCLGTRYIRRLSKYVVLFLILAGCGLQACVACTNGVDLIRLERNLKGDARAYALQHEDCHITLRHKGSAKSMASKELEADRCATIRTGKNPCEIADIFYTEKYYDVAKAISKRNNCDG